MDNKSNEIMLIKKHEEESHTPNVKLKTQTLKHSRTYSIDLEFDHIWENILMPIGGSLSAKHNVKVKTPDNQSLTTTCHQVNTFLPKIRASKGS